ncbi:MAG: hypothetical protein QM662_06165 [Gordonia sp. (in: high G+C Gram-positive bacteria)]
MNRTVKASAALAAAGFALAAGTGTAAAAPQSHYARTAGVPTVAYGPACAGQVFGHATAKRATPGMVTFHTIAMFAGISGTPRMCEVTATFHWRNTATGARGSVGGITGGVWLTDAQNILVREVRTGSGPVTFTLTTDRPYLAQPPATIDVF